MTADEIIPSLFTRSIFSIAMLLYAPEITCAWLSAAEQLDATTSSDFRIGLFLLVD